MDFFKKRVLVFYAFLLLLGLVSCREEDEQWGTLVSQAANDAALTIKYETTEESWNSFPGFEQGGLPDQLAVFSIPIQSKESYQISIHHNGSLEIFTEIIPVEQIGFESEYEEASPENTPVETRYIHFNGGSVLYYDESMRLIHSMNQDLGDFSDVLEEIKRSESKLNAVASGMASGNPFLWALNPADGNVEGVVKSSGGYTRLKNDYFDELTQTYFKQELIVNDKDQTIEQIRNYNEKNELIDISRLKYDKTGSAPRLMHISDISKGEIDGIETVTHTNTQYENFQVTLNLKN